MKIYRISLKPRLRFTIPYYWYSGHVNEQFKYFDFLSFPVHFSGQYRFALCLFIFYTCESLHGTTSRLFAAIVVVVGVVVGVIVDDTVPVAIVEGAVVAVSRTLR